MVEKRNEWTVIGVQRFGKEAQGNCNLRGEFALPKKEGAVSIKNRKENLLYQILTKSERTDRFKEGISLPEGKTIVETPSVETIKSIY
jgi:hypothetical protein